jgi:broad specificity phosphatase PhoE
MKRIYLIRHGQAAPPGILLGQTDADLTPAGTEECHILRQVLSDMTFAKAFISPLKRTRQTLDIILGGRDIPVTVVPGLTEVSLGEWEGLTKGRARKLWPEVWAKRGEDFFNTPPPGGESLKQLSERVWPAYERIRAETADPTLIVAHQAVNRLILCKENHIPVENLLYIEQPTGAMTILKFDS